METSYTGLYCKGYCYLWLFQGATPAVTLKLRKPKTDKKIKWTEETVDNEGMGKKKSKCK